MNKNIKRKNAKDYFFDENATKLDEVKYELEFLSFGGRRKFMVWCKDGWEKDLFYKLKCIKPKCKFVRYVEYVQQISYIQTFRCHDHKVEFFKGGYGTIFCLGCAKYTQYGEKDEETLNDYCDECKKMPTFEDDNLEYKKSKSSRKEMKEYRNPPMKVDY